MKIKELAAEVKEKMPSTAQRRPLEYASSSVPRNVAAAGQRRASGESIIPSQDAEEGTEACFSQR
jgi:hypothetical protein